MAILQHIVEEGAGKPAFARPDKCDAVLPQMLLRSRVNGTNTFANIRMQ